MTRVIRWFVGNPVAANLILVMIVAGGLITLPTIVKEFFPDFSLDVIRVTVVYRGASPEEVERGVVIRIEEAIQDLEGIKRMTSSAAENLGTVVIEVRSGYDTRKLLDEIKVRVDGIDTFPEEAEKPTVEEMTNRRQVINVAVFGRADEMSLRRIAERVRDELMEQPGITYATLSNARPYEIAIEVSEETLRRYGLTFDEVAQAVRRSSLDVPAGTIETRAEEIQIRTLGQAYTGAEYARIPLRTLPDGTRILLGEVATIRDGFEDTDQWTTFNGQPAQVIEVYRVGDQSILDVAETVKAYVADADRWLPAGIELQAFEDQSTAMRGRIDLLLRNGAMGFVLVFISLALFLRLRLAFWVSLGIPISFLGALWLMPTLDVTINMISLFAFIVVLGIVVDDAIVVGENIFTWQERTGKGVEGAVEGARRVAVPVIFAVLTTIAAFVPILNVEGNTGKIMRVIPLIVIPTLVFSLIESLLVLPAHLRHPRRREREQALARRGGLLAPLRAVNRAWTAFQARFAGGVEFVIHRIYRPMLDWGLRWRYLTIAIGVSTLLLTAGLVGGGFIKFIFFPTVEADFVGGRVTMPLGTPETRTAEAVARLERAAERLREQIRAETGQDAFRTVRASVGAQPLRGRQGGPGSQRGGFSGAHLGEVSIELLPSEQRTVTSREIVSRWRELVGPIPEAREVAFTSSLFSPGEPINVQLTGFRMEDLVAAAAALRAKLETYEGVYDVADSYQAGKREIKLTVLPEAEAAGVRLGDLGRQVRQAFFGEEAQRIQRGRDDVRVMVRYPESERRSLADLAGMRIRTAAGGEIPFGSVARARIGEGYASITRVDRRRAVNVTAEVDETRGNANEILADLQREFLPELKARFPGLTWSFEGQGREQQDTLRGLLRGFAIALVAIYALMAVPFRSYVQPLLVMTAIPFGLVGAVWGHVLMGLDLTILSMFGLVALTGVVVNDSLVLVDYINVLRRDGVSLDRAVRDAGVARFRPILLTSITTFAGLMPLILERSVQAQFLIPLAVSLGFGVVFSTFISLGLVPAGYLVIEDVKRLLRRAAGRPDPVATDGLPA
ncbi:MAG: efflux RND transporter permease subunit [Acidobacteriota bacterium]